MIVCQQTTNVNIPSKKSAALAIASNTARTGWSIQNLSTNPLFVSMGVTAATTSVFHVVLKAATGADDGSGGSVGQEEGVVFTGDITIAGSSPSYTTTEFAA